MPELIERYATIGAIPAPTDADEAEYYGKVCDAIEAMPTIEAEPVRHGQWIPLKGWFNKGIVKCSFCGNTLNMNGVNAGRGDANLCPNCGTKMYQTGGTISKERFAESVGAGNVLGGSNGG